MGICNLRQRSGYVVGYDAPTTRLVDTPGMNEVSSKLLGQGAVDWAAKLVQSCLTTFGPSETGEFSGISLSLCLWAG